MPATRTCPDCGAEIPPDAPEGLCPRCLAALAAGAITEPDGEDREDPEPSLSALAELFPELEMVDRIGRGGMGVVYRVRQAELNRFAALKILHPGLAIDPGFRTRFRNEARTLAALNHPNIVTIYNFGERGDLFYFLMEYVDGGDLSCIPKAEPLTSNQVLSIVRQICDAVAFAHDAGVVHRDLKPANILVDQQGRVKVADFGVAKLLGGPDAGVPGGYVVGTPAYMAPEQRDQRQDVDHRADIYSLGAVFYELLTGSPPADKLEPPSSKRLEIDVQLDKVVLRALEKKPERRYQQVSELRTQIQRVADPQRFPVVSVLLGMVVLVALVMVLHDQATDAERAPPPSGPPIWENALGMTFLPVPGTEVLMARHETRVCDWQAFEDSGHAPRQPGIVVEPDRGPAFPVVLGEREAVEAFCRWLTRTEWTSGELPTNEAYRLPTDHEWSLAAGLVEPPDSEPGDLHLVGEETYPWGTQAPAPAGAGNYPDTALRERMPNAVVIPSYYDGHATAAPVEQFPPNANGFHDLGGNLWEMVTLPGTNTPGPIAFRGGSWFSGSGDGDWHCLLSSFRAEPSKRKPFESGFRLVRAARETSRELSLLEAAKEGDGDRVLRILEARPDVGSDLLNQALRNAASAGSVELLDTLLAAGADPNASDAAGTTALHEAAEAGSLPATERLLAAGARPDSLTKWISHTPAHLAASVDAVEVLEALARAGARMDRTTGLETILASAALNDSTRAIRWLVAHGVDVNLRDALGGTPLAKAALTRRINACKVLLELGAEVNQPTSTPTMSPLVAAVTAADEGIVDLLLAHGADVEDPMLAAALSMDLASGSRQAMRRFTAGPGSFDGVISPPPEPAVKARITRRLVKHGLPLELRHENGMTPLLWAAYQGQFEVFQALLELGADPEAIDNKEFSALHSAAEQGYPRLVERILAQGADPEAQTEDGRTALLCATISINDRRDAVVEVLVRRGARINATDRSGATPLHHAASRGDAMLVEVLLARGADPTRRTRSGETVLMSAAGGPDRTRSALDQIRSKRAFQEPTDGREECLGSEEEYARCVELLLARKVDPGVEHPSGRTAVTKAAEHDQVEIVRALLDAGVAVDILDRKAMTPLHWAAMGNGVRAAKLLLERGANIAPPLNPMTPLHCAASEGHTEVADLLLEHGAGVNALDGKGATPLHWAVVAGSEDLVRLLTARGANLDARDFAYSTPLHGAVLLGNTEVVRALVEGGAGLAARNFEGAAPLDLARMKRNMDIIGLLETASLPGESRKEMP